MKLFRDFLEECIGKPLVLWLKSLPQTALQGFIYSVEADYIIWHGKEGTTIQYLYIPINNIDTVSNYAQNSEN